jgi:Domain of Unknown Function (DUF1080)
MRINVQKPPCVGVKHLATLLVPFYLVACGTPVGGTGSGGSSGGTAGTSQGMDGTGGTSGGSGSFGGIPTAGVGGGAGAIGSGGVGAKGGVSGTGGTPRGSGGFGGIATAGMGGEGGSGGGGARGGLGGASSGGAGNGGHGGIQGSEPDAGVDGPSPSSAILSVCPNCKPIFDGTSLNGWVQVPASQWSVVNGAMHSTGSAKSARGFIYTTNTYGDFRFIFTSRLIQDPNDNPPHVPCVLFWGESLTADAMEALQVQPPKGYMWDYRPTGPTAGKSPDMYETRVAGAPSLNDTQWSQCEMLANRTAGTMRFACCPLTGGAPCKASEIVDFKDPTAGRLSPLALQVHTAGMVEEFKDLYVESPVADPANLVTTH